MISRKHNNGREKLLQDMYKATSVMNGKLLCWSENEHAWMDVPAEVHESFADFIAEQELLHKGGNEDETNN